MSRVHLVIGDLPPQIFVQLKQPGRDNLLDVSGATVLLKVKPFGKDDVVLFQLTGTPLPGTLQANLIDPDESQYPVPGSGGRVRFNFIEGNLALPPGRYLGEIEVVYGPGNSFTPFKRLELVLREDF